MNSTLDNSDAFKLQKSPAAIRKAQESSPHEHRKSVVLNETSLDKGLGHWSEFKINGKKIQRRSYHTAVFHEKSLYAYGGYEVNQGILQDFVSVNLDDSLPTFEWEEVEVKSQLKPGPLCRHSAVVYQDKMFIYGGQISSLKNTAQFMAFDFTTRQWENVTPVNSVSLPPLDSHSAVLWEKDSENTSMIVLGGFVGGKVGDYSNAVFEYKFKENQWDTLFANKAVELGSEESARVPPGRMSFGAAVHQNDLYLFGGNEGNTKFNDLWKFDLLGKKWEPVNTADPATVPEPRSGLTMMAYKNLLVVFGGILDITHEKNDIFVFNISKNAWNAAEQTTKWLITSDDNKAGLKSSPKKPSKSEKTSPHGSPGKHIHSPSPSKFKTAKQETEAESQVLDKSVEVSTLDKTMTSPRRAKFGKLELPTSYYGGSPQGKSARENGGGAQQVYKSTMEENHIKNKLLQKMVLLNEFEVTEKEADALRVTTPATDSLLKSIQSLTITPMGSERFDYGAIPAGEVTMQKMGRKEEKVKVGVKPVGRDGHSATVREEKMYIFAGDRHKMSFNDLFTLDLTYLSNL